MKRLTIRLTLSCLAATLSCAAWAQNETHAGRAIKDGMAASGHASASAAHSIVASGQVTSAAIAVPLSVGGAALASGGAVSAAAARDSMKAATAPIGTPLPVTDEAITVMPPNQALKAKDKPAKTQP